jgi:DtxR family Mn-dependent transcriptional regulator
LLENTDFGSFLEWKIRFSWDEVHEIAEQLEHIKSEKLINKWMIFWKPYRRPSWGSIPNAKDKF